MVPVKLEVPTWVWPVASSLLNRAIVVICCSLPEPHLTGLRFCPVEVLPPPGTQVALCWQKSMTFVNVSIWPAPLSLREKGLCSRQVIRSAPFISSMMRHSWDASPARFKNRRWVVFREVRFETKKLLLSIGSCERTTVYETQFNLQPHSKKFEPNSHKPLQSMQPTARFSFLEVRASFYDTLVSSVAGSSSPTRM